MQARSVFNPLPLTKDQNPELVSQIQAVITAARLSLNAPQEEDREASQSLIVQLSSKKTQGLWWNQELVDQTSHFWDSHIQAGGRFQSSVPSWMILTLLVFRPGLSWYSHFM